MVVQGSAAWELDFWGRYRRATESARAQLLATEWGRRAIVTTLVSEVADAYFELRALDLELDVSRRTLGIAAGVAQAHQLSASEAGPPRCSTCVRPSSSSTPPPARLPRSSG